MDSIYPNLGEDAVEDFYPNDDFDQDVDSQPPTPYGMTWAFDFYRGDLLFGPGGQDVKVYGLDTLMEWVLHALSVDRLEIPTLGPSMGTDIKGLLGSKDDAYISARISKEISDALSQHDRIKSVEVNDLFKMGTVLYAYIKLETTEGLTSTQVLPLQG